MPRLSFSISSSFCSYFSHYIVFLKQTFASAVSHKENNVTGKQQRFSRAFLPCSYPLPPATSQGSNRPLPQRPLLQAGFLLLCDLTFAATATSSPAPAPCSCSPASAVLPHAVQALSGSPCYGRLILYFLDLMALASPPHIYCFCRAVQWSWFTRAAAQNSNASTQSASVHLCFLAAATVILLLSQHLPICVFLLQQHVPIKQIPNYRFAIT